MSHSPSALGPSLVHLRCHAIRRFLEDCSATVLPGAEADWILRFSIVGRAGTRNRIRRGGVQLPRFGVHSSGVTPNVRSGRITRTEAGRFSLRLLVIPSSGSQLDQNCRPRGQRVSGDGQPCNPERMHGPEHGPHPVCSNPTLFRKPFLQTPKSWRRRRNPAPPIQNKHVRRAAQFDSSVQQWRDFPKR
jgi:hypothetical protein